MKNIRISRRRALQGAGLLAAAGVLMPGGFKVAFADAPVEQRFVLYILRGAADGLSLIPPYGDKDYKAERGALALPKNLYTPLDDFYGASRDMPAFIKMFQEGEAAAVQAVASPYRNRSHFDAQNVLETGLAAPAKVHEGWLNRVLALYGARRDGIGLAFGQAVPLVAQGKMPVFCWAPSEQGLPEQGLLTSLRAIYADDPLFQEALTGAIGVHGMLNTAENAAMPVEKEKDATLIKSPAEFASSSELKMVPNKIAVHNAMNSIGSLLSNPKGPRIATIDQGGWDTHILQGTDTGMLPFNASLLDTAFESLKASLGEHWKNTIIMVATEFGRTVAPNGTIGTDHGTASCVLLAGGALNGGKVYGDWPGLAKDKQFKNRDLNPTTDMRSIAKAILSEHLGFAEKDTDGVFPDSADVQPLEGIIKKSG